MAKAQLLNQLPLKNRTNSESSFAAACLQLFSNKEKGHMAAWLYETDNEKADSSGADIYNVLSRDTSDFYVLRKSEKAFLRTLDYLKLTLKKQHINTLVELGSGPVTDSTKAILKTLVPVGTYIPVDIVEDYVVSACHITSEAPSFKIIPTHGNFLEIDKSFYPNTKKLFLMRGCTVGNIDGAPNTSPDENTIYFLKALKRSMCPEDLFVFDFDSNTNSEEIKRCYNQPQSKHFILSLLHRIRNQLTPSGSFNPNHYTHDVVWYPETNQCAHTVVAQDNQQFTLGNAVVHVREGQRFFLANSYKYHPEAMKTYLKLAGFSGCEIIGTDDNPIKLALARV